MKRIRSRLLTILLMAAMILGNLNLASLATGPGENGPETQVAPRAIQTVNQTTVADFRAGSGFNLTLFNESGGELRLRGFDVFDLGIAGISPIRDVEVDSKGKLYIGTQPGTVLVFDPVTGVVTDLGRAVPDEDNINRLTMDKNDTLWGGGRSFNGVTPNRGGILWRMNTTTMRIDAAGKVEMVYNQIRGMTSDKNGTIWVGDMNGVLARFDPTTGAVTRINGGNALIPGYGIFRLAAAPNGMIYAGTSNVGTGGRVMKIDPTTNAFQVLNSNNPIVVGDGVQALAAAKNGTVYGGTANVGGTLFMINTSNDQITLLGKPIPGDGSIGDLYPAADGSVYGTAGAGTLTDFHLFNIENGTGRIIDVGIPFPGVAFPSMLAVAPDGTVYGSGNNQFIYRLSPEYSKTPAARLNRISSGRIFTENFELSDINWDWSASGGPVNFIREVDASRPSGDQMVYTETADNSGAANAKAGSNGPIGTNPTSFPGTPASVYEITFKMNYGVGGFCGTRLYMDYYAVNQNYMLWFIEDTDTIILLRDGVWIQTYNGTPLDHGAWYDVKWSTYHVGAAAAFNVWLNGAKIFDEVPLVAPLRQSGSIILGTRVANASFDAVRLYKDTNITVSGLQAGQKVTLLSSNGTLISTNTAAGASLMLNVNQTSFPMAGYFNITDTGGVNVNYSSPVYPDVYGGDVYDLNTNPLGSLRYFPNGTFLSQPIDTGFVVDWKTLRWSSNVPIGTNIMLRTKTAPTMAGLGTAPWGQYVNSSPSQMVQPNDRWVQFEVEMNTSIPTTTPELRDVSIDFEVFPNFTIGMNQSASILYPDDVITYNILYNQTGNGLARDVVISDFLPSELTLLNSSNEGSRNGSLWKLAAITPYYTGVLAVQARVRTDTADNVLISNSASINFTDGDGTVIGNYSTPPLSARIVRPVLLFSLAGPAACGPGDGLRFNITIINIGNGVAKDLWANLTLDRNLTIVDSSNEGARQGSTWHLTDVLGPSNITFTAKVNQATPDGALLCTTASLNYTMPSGYEPAGNFTGPVKTIVNAPIMDVAKAVDASGAFPGDTLTYTIFLNNTGSGSASGVIIKDVLAPELEYVNSSVPRNVADGSWNIGNMQNGSRDRLTITARVKSGTTDGTLVKNTAIVNYSTAAGIELAGRLTNEVSTSIGKLALPNITLDVAADRDTAAWNETVNFTIYYNNTGDGIALYATISDALPAGLTFVTSGAESNRAGSVWSFSSVPGGAHGLTITARVDAGVANNTVLTNMVTLSYADERGKTMPASFVNASLKVTVYPVVPPSPTRPTITDRSPIPDATNVPVDTAVTITFSAPMNKNTLTTAFAISPAVRGSITCAGNIMTFTPTTKLDKGTKYTLTVTTEARDESGSMLDKTYSWSFTTQAKGTNVAGENNWVPYALLAAVIIGVLAVVAVAATRKRQKSPPPGSERGIKPEEPSGPAQAGGAVQPLDADAGAQKAEPSWDEQKPVETAKPEEKPPEPPKEEQKPEPPKETPKPPEPKPEPPKEQPKPEPPKEVPKPPEQKPEAPKEGKKADVDDELQALLKKLTE